MTHQEDSTTIAQAATENGCSGLAAHLSWALHLDEAQAAKVAEIAAQWSDPAEGQYAFDRCESPAERLFILGAMLGGDDQPLKNFEIRDSSDPEADYYGPDMGRWPDETAIAEWSDGFIHSQVKIGNKRLDFVFDYGFDRKPFERLAVEIDGHEWHERTKEQAGSDRARDIDLLELGILVIRFTGSQVYADPVGCMHRVAQVIRYLNGMHDEIDNRVYNSYLRGREEATSELLDVGRAGADPAPAEPVESAL